MTFRKFALGAAVISLAHAGAVQAAESENCLTVAEAEALVTYLLPKAVEASRDRCANSLPASAPLLMENSEQLARYNAASAAAWPAARDAVGVIAGNDFPAELDDEILRPIADAMFSQMIGEEIKPKDCALIDKIYSDLEPMPTANLASLTITIVREATKGDKKQDIPICKGPA